VLNAANEVAVEAFLAERIRFDQIHQVNHETLQQTQHGLPDSLEALLALDQQARAVARALVQRLQA